MMDDSLMNDRQTKLSSACNLIQYMSQSNSIKLLEIFPQSEIFSHFEVGNTKTNYELDFRVSWERCFQKIWLFKTALST